MKAKFARVMFGSVVFDFSVRRRRPVPGIVALLCMCLVVGLVGSSSAQQAESFELSKSVEKKIAEKVVPLLETDDYAAFQMELGKVITKVGIAKFDDIEALGRSLNVGSLKSLYFEQWKDEVLRGQVADNPKLKRSVAFYLAAGLVDTIDRLANEVERHELVTTDELPEDWRESRNFFLSAESLVRRVEDLENVARRMDLTLKPFRKSRKPKKDIVTATGQRKRSSLAFATTQCCRSDLDATWWRF